MRLAALETFSWLGPCKHVPTLSVADEKVMGEDASDGDMALEFIRSGIILYRRPRRLI